MLSGGEPARKPAATLDALVISLLDADASVREAAAAGRESSFGMAKVLTAFTAARNARAQARAEALLQLVQGLVRSCLDGVADGGGVLDAVRLGCERKGYAAEEYDPVVRAEWEAHKNEQQILKRLGFPGGKGVCVDLKGLRVSGMSALYYAAVSGNTSIADRLLERYGGVDGGCEQLELSWQDKLGYSVLHFLAGANPSTPFTTSLLRKILRACPSSLLALGTFDQESGFGCEPGGRTPLHCAVLGDNTDAVKMLLEAKADPTAKDLCSSTPEDAYLCYVAAKSSKYKSLGTTDLAAAVRKDGVLSLLPKGSLPGWLGGNGGAEDWKKLMVGKRNADQIETKGRIRKRHAAEVKANVSEIKGRVSKPSNPYKIVIVPGAGGEVHAMRANWYSWLAKELVRLGLRCEMPWDNMPEPSKCRERIWKRYIVEKMIDESPSESCILVGHSTGADAILRVSEDLKVHGLVICSSGQLAESLRDEMTEEESKDIGYYDRPWNWARIKANTRWIVHFHAEDDDVVPVDEGRRIHKALQTEYTELEDGGHLLMPEFPALLRSILGKLQAEAS